MTESATYLFDSVYLVLAYRNEGMHLFPISFVYLIVEL